MDLYQAIVRWYDEIFPYNPAQLEFVLGTLSNADQAALLEIGCATGSLTLGLAEHCREVTGIDIDRQMIEIAEQKIGDKARIIRGDMLTVTDLFAEGSFDGICCFGNTLVHLDSTDQIRSFLKAVRRILREGSPLNLR